MKPYTATAFSFLLEWHFAFAERQNLVCARLSPVKQNKKSKQTNKQTNKQQKRRLDLPHLS